MSWWTRFRTWVRGIDLTKEIDDIQKMTVECCGFLPTVGTVASILTAGNPTVLTATAIATAICDVVKKRNRVATLLGSEVAGPATVNGIEIEGGFVK